MTELDQEVGRLYRAGSYQEELPVAQRALAMAEQRHGADDPLTARSASSLAVHRQLAGKAGTRPRPRASSPPMTLQAIETAFVFAHPDDDTLVAGTIRKLLDEGADVHCVWVTGAEHDAPRKALRQAETQRAMETLGVEPHRLHFLDLPFLGLLPILDQAADRLADLFRLLRPRQVVSVAFEGGHVDHDAVSFLAHEAVRRTGLECRLFEFPLYNGSGPLHWYRFRVNAFPPDDPSVFHVPLSPAALSRKYAMMARYESQRGFMVTFRVIAWLRGHARKGEPLRPCPLDRDHTLPPHRGVLNIERWFNRYMGVRFEDFRSAVIAARRPALVALV